jgi:Na+-transporting NADH:ubiquinone oxidoreductase subunit NqrB
MPPTITLPRWLQVPLDFLKRDGRHFQLLYLGAFLLYGILSLGWDVDLGKIALVILTCLGTQAVLARAHGLGWHTLKSAAVSSLGLSILLKTNLPMTAVLAAFLAISSKFVLRVDRKHIFNPVNFAIAITTLFTGDAWVSPGQWGNSFTTVYFVGAAGLIVLLKVGRIDISLAFLGTYLGLELIRSVFWLGWPADHFVHLMTNGTLMLFTFFMITDPVTTPNHPKARMLWAAMVGILTFCFIHILYMQAGAPIWALFVLSPITLVLDQVFVHRRFAWF